MRLLADLATETDKQPLGQQRIDRDRALSEARRAIMLAAWDPKWGNPEDFQQWLNSGGKKIVEEFNAAYQNDPNKKK